MDGDEQGTARAFTQLRSDILGAPGYTAVPLHGAENRRQVRVLRSKYESILIDLCGGRDAASLRAALKVSDSFIVPVLPGTFDAWSLEPLGHLIQEVREINGELRVVAVLNAADAQWRDNDEAAVIIREKVGFEYFPHPIIRRKAFPQRCRHGSIGSGVSAGGRVAIAKHLVRKTKAKDKLAEKFIMAAAPLVLKETTRGDFIQTPIRLPKELLERIDGTAKRIGLNRSSWLWYAANRELDREEPKNAGASERLSHRKYDHRDGRRQQLCRRSRHTGMAARHGVIL